MARTVCWHRRAAFLVALVLGLAGHGALAQPYTQEGETAVARATQGIADANGDIVKFRDMTIRWRFDVLMGSPLRQFAGRYTHYDPPWVELAGVQTCFAGRRIGAFRPLKLEPQMLTDGVLDQDLIYAHTRFNMIIQPNARLSFMITGADRYIQHEFMVDTFSTGSEYGLSVPGSPEWDRMFQYGHEGSPNNPWLTEAQTRELFEVGFTVSRIEMIEPRYALTLARASYERHFGASACGDEPAQTIAEAEEQDEGGADEAPARPSEPETPADRLAAMLTRVADAQQQAREEQARLEEARQQEVETGALALPESGEMPLMPGLPSENQAPSIESKFSSTSIINLDQNNLGYITVQIAESIGVEVYNFESNIDIYMYTIKELEKYNIYTESDLIEFILSVKEQLIESVQKSRYSNPDVDIFLRSAMIADSIEIYLSDPVYERNYIYEDVMYEVINNLYGPAGIEKMAESNMYPFFM